MERRGGALFQVYGRCYGRMEVRISVVWCCSRTENRPHTLTRSCSLSSAWSTFLRTKPHRSPIKPPPMFPGFACIFPSISLRNQLAIMDQMCWNPIVALAGPDNTTMFNATSTPLAVELQADTAAAATQAKNPAAPATKKTSNNKNLRKPKKKSPATGASSSKRAAFSTPTTSKHASTSEPSTKPIAGEKLVYFTSRQAARVKRNVRVSASPEEAAKFGEELKRATSQSKYARNIVLKEWSHKAWLERQKKKAEKGMVALEEMMDGMGM